MVIGLHNSDFNNSIMFSIDGCFAESTQFVCDDLGWLVVSSNSIAFTILNLISWFFRATKVIAFPNVLCPNLRPFLVGSKSRADGESVTEAMGEAGAWNFLCTKKGKKTRENSLLWRIILGLWDPFQMA